MLISITVKTFSGVKLPISIDDSSTVEQIREKILNENLATEIVLTNILLHNTKMIQKEDTLKQFNVQTGDELIFVSRFR